MTIDDAHDCRTLILSTILFGRDDEQLHKKFHDDDTENCMAEKKLLRKINDIRRKDLRMSDHLTRNTAMHSMISTSNLSYPKQVLEKTYFLSL